MRAVVQRVMQASVSINNKVHSQIGLGLVVLLGVAGDDSIDDVQWLSGKIVRLRIFDDDNEVMNRGLHEVGGEILLVSQFTLFASTEKGNRPSYSRAARPEIAVPLYQEFIRNLQQQLGREVQTGEFGADMQISLINHGPVTILFDTKTRE